MSKPPILAVHGMWSVPAIFDSIAADMARNGYTVDATDHRPGAVARAGSLQKVGLADYLASLEEMAATLPEKPILMGHSLGGLLAQLLAVKIQPRALILLSTAPSHGSIILPTFSSLKSVWGSISSWGYWHKETLLSRADALYGVYNNVSAEEAAQGIAQLVPDSGRVLAQIAFSAFDNSKVSVVDYTKITCPTLVMCGDEDRITPSDISRATARRMAGPVAYKEMDGFGHWTVGSAGTPIVSSTVRDFLGAHGI
jgi:pimeloyl-ACP methyl ester carboxylesterase